MSSIRIRTGGLVTEINPFYFHQSKLDEEREIYDQERDSTDEKFRALEMKIKGKQLLLWCNLRIVKVTLF